jgi:hypothetical protein
MLGGFLGTSLQNLQWSRYRKQCPLVNSALELMPVNNLVYAVNISPRYRYVYVDNPKTGCSSLKSALVELEFRGMRSDVDSYDWTVFHDPLKSPLKRLADLGAKAPLTYLVTEGYKFVTFVRNPYTRVLSCYRDKVLKNRQQKRIILRLMGHSGEDIEQPVSFGEFVRAIIRQTDYEMNPHWRVQTSQTLYGILDYSFVGRFECYQEDFLALFRHLGVPDAEIPPVRHLNRTREGAREGCVGYYTEELQELVYRRYQKDFENFGYPYDLPE